MPKKIYGYTKDTRVTAIVLDGQAVDPSIVYDGEIRIDTPASGEGLVKQPVPVMGNTTRKSKMPKLEGLGVLRRQPIHNLPVSLAVVIGESNKQYTERPFDATDVEVTVTYMDGSSKVLEVGAYTVDPSTMPAEAGACDVAFAYTEYGVTVTATEEFTVIQDAVAELAVSGALVNAQYQGMAPDITGLVATATYLSGKTEIVTEDVVVTPAVYSETGVQNITLTYAAVSTVVEVTVISDVPVSLAVSGELANPQYQGAAPDITGLVVTAVYTSGKTEVVTADVTVTPTTYSETGEQNITLTYSGVSTTVAVTVIADYAVSLTYTGTPSVQTIGEAPNLDSLTFTVTMASGASSDVTASVTVMPETIAADTTQLTVSYSGVSCTVDVTVA